MKKALLLVILFSMSVAGLIGCSSGMGPVDEISDIEIGTPKNDIVQRLGKPENWVTLRPPSTQVSLHIDFDLGATKQQMPSGEVWLFEYAFPNGDKYVVHFFEDKVQNVVEGALLKE